MHTEDFVEEITNKSKIYIARWFQPKESPGYFHARILFPIISIQGRKGDENYAIYTTISRAAIDLLSYATLQKLDGKEWRREHLLSLAGVYQPAKEIEKSKVHAALAKALKI